MVWVGCRLKRYWAGPLALLVALLFAAAGAQADTFESLLSPGPLIRGHQKFEDTCSKCHDLFKKSSQNDKCLACHNKIGRDLKIKKGFHGKSPLVLKEECKKCHTDHKGRLVDIVNLDQDTFNHTVTDFVLKGKHKAVPCSNCHRSGTKFREAPYRCYSCHKADDKHLGRMGKKCGKCHGNDSWLKARFEHDKTKFKLTGKHNRLSCDRCHPGQRFKNTPKKCFGCHSLNDIHLGKLGKKCQECHTSISWKKILFDHNRKTKFPLKGSHKKVKCSGCHKENIYDKNIKKKLSVKVKKACVGCHRNDDRHKGRFGEKCGKCHVSTRWREVIFKHDKDTKFRIVGAHRKLTCENCHKGNPYKDKLGRKCYDCHQSDDVHKGQEGKQCGKCHTSFKWMKSIKFDHDLTLFPLIGMHAITTCENCHLHKKFKNVKSKCVECHKEKDVHKERFGFGCHTCHNPNGWNLWLFDHGVRTEFPLDGSHEGLQCQACHKEPVKADIKLEKDCYECHRDEDIHHGSFGKKCDRCHLASSWDELNKRLRFGTGR